MSLDRRLVALVLVLVAAFAFGFHRLALSPKYAAQRELDAEIATQEDARTASAGQLDRARAARRRYRGNYASVVRLGKAVPSTADTSTLVYQLQVAAQRAGVAFKSLKVTGDGKADAAPAAAGAPPLPAGTVTGPAGFAVLPLELTFTGGFFGVDGVLRRVRSFVRIARERVGVRGRLVVVDSLSLEPGDGGFPQIRATVKARAFLLPAGETATGIAAPGDTAAPAPSPAATPTASSGKVVDQ